MSRRTVRIKRVNRQEVGVEEVSNDSLACRDLRHSWTHVTDHVTKGTKDRVREIERILVCTRCGADRYDIFKIPSFEKVKTKTTYPEGYLLKNGRTNVREVRQEIFKRTGGLIFGGKK